MAAVRVAKAAERDSRGKEAVLPRCFYHAARKKEDGDDPLILTL